MANLAGGAIKASTPFQLYRRLALAGDGIASQTITAAVTLTDRHEEIIVLNPSTGTRVVTLTTAAQGAKKGQFHLIYNSGSTYSLTINKPAATTLCTLRPGESCVVAYGTAWTLVMQAPAVGALVTDSISARTGTTGTFIVNLVDNLVDALAFKEANNSYVSFKTQDGQEAIVCTKVITANGGVTGNVTGNVTGSAGTANALAPAAMFQSTEVTNAGAAITTAHGMGSVPHMFWISYSDIPAGAFTATVTADGTNVTVTASAACKYYVYAIK